MANSLVTALCRSSVRCCTALLCPVAHIGAIIATAAIATAATSTIRSWGGHLLPGGFIGGEHTVALVLLSGTKSDIGRCRV